MDNYDVAKVIEVVGSSDKGWAEAADTAVRVAAKSIKHITGIQVMTMTAQIKDGRIHTYKAAVKVAFGVDA